MTPDMAEAVTGTRDLALCQRLLVNVSRSMWMPSGIKSEEIEQRIEAAMAALKGIKPRTELEGMLAVQIVATHDAAMECLRRAALEGQTFEGRQAALKNADKLMSLYLRQLDALDKHRGKGQQKVTVEHVHVEAGGQAVVGVVQSAGNPSRRAKKATEQRAIGHQTSPPLDLSPRPAPNRVRAKRR